jgi:hypothetical protein
MQNELPLLPLKKPEGQFKHNETEADPLPSRYLPTAHEMHVSEDCLGWSLYLPELHSSQSPELEIPAVAENLPTGQSAQLSLLIAPVEGPKNPSGHN